MSASVIGLFEDPVAAQEAANELIRRGFRAAAIDVIAGAPVDPEGLVAELEVRAVSHERAAFYAGEVDRGGALVITETDEPPGQAAAVLDTHGSLCVECIEHDRARPV